MNIFVNACLLSIGCPVTDNGEAVPTLVYVE